MGYVCRNLCRIRLNEKSRWKKIESGKNRDEIPAKVRSEVMRRDRGRCRWCGTRSNVELHHIIYRSGQGPHVPHNLTALCSYCHKEAHSDKKQYQPLLLAAIWMHYVVDGKPINIGATKRLLAARAAGASSG